MLPYISSSTDFILEDWGIERMLEGYVGTSYDLKLEFPNGKLKSLKLTIKKTEKEEVFPPIEKKELLDFEWVRPDMAYVSLNSFSDEKIALLFKEKIPELKKKALIVDLRFNGGGNTDIGKDIFKHLTNDTVLYGSKTQSRLLFKQTKITSH